MINLLDFINLAIYLKLDNVNWGHALKPTWIEIHHLILHKIIRSSRPEVFCKKGVLKNFAKFTGKQLRHSLFFNKVAVLRAATLLKKRLWHRCFPVSFVKFLRRRFLTEHLRRTASESYFCKQVFAKLCPLNKHAVCLLSLASFHASHCKGVFSSFRYLDPFKRLWWICKNSL